MSAHGQLSTLANESPTARAGYEAAIVAPLPEELWGVRRRLGRRRRLKEPQGALEGTLAGRRVLVAAVGAGARSAGSKLASLLATHDVAHVVVLGLAGGLSPDLRVGALVTGPVRALGQPAARTPDPMLLALATHAIDIRKGMLVSGDRWAGTPDAKSTLWNSVGNPSHATLDVESWAMTTIASEAGRPWIVLRCVSDLAQEGLPAFLLACEGPGGTLDRGRLLRKTLAAPWRLIPLMRLGLVARRSSRALADAACQIIERLPGDTRGARLPGG